MTEASGSQLSRWALWFGGLAFFTGQTALGVIQPTIGLPVERGDDRQPGAGGSIGATRSASTRSR